MKSLIVFQELGLLAMSPESFDAPSVPNTPGTPGSAHHVYHHHNALWDYCKPALARPFAGGGGPEVFATPPAGTTLGQAMERTRFLVFIGARRTPELDAALARTEGVCLVFEPDLDRLRDYLSGVKPWELANRGVFFVGGDPDRLAVPLLSMLPEAMCNLGYPLFFACGELAEAMPGYTRRVEEMVELFYYRNVIYSLDSQDNIRGLPLRPMTRDYIYDRLKHLYENLAPCLTGGVLQDLLGALPGQCAILAAAGPALADSLDFIRANRDRAVLIAVNSALKPLLGAGITPDFVVINDTSTDSEPTLAGLPPLPGTILTAHCLSTTGATPEGEPCFGRTHFFGNFPGQPFPKRASLLLHGSVITTAFALAEYLGCTKAVLAGVQLSSPDPLIMNYARGSQHEGQVSGVTELAFTSRWPELYPVQAADGSRKFTTLNFFDAAQWFADRIRQAGLEVVNLCPGSILKGPGIVFDPAPALPEAPGLAEKLAAIGKSDLTRRRDRVLDYIRQEMLRWKNKQLAARQAGKGLREADAFIAASDRDNTSFMLQRFGDFDNARFHAAYFEGAGDDERMEAAGYFLEAMDAMCAALLKILRDQHVRVGRIPTD
ncbi:MAG: 6-hydroxymethylpterin diphosphokinase MptE-like protein [Acidobacteriota bacterium]